MDDEKILELLKIDLGIMNDTYDKLLAAQISAARDYIAEEGIALDMSSNGDAYTLVMYAAWLYKKRESSEGMPRMLRRRLNNRIYGRRRDRSTDA